MHVFTDGGDLSVGYQRAQLFDLQATGGAKGAFQSAIEGLIESNKADGREKSAFSGDIGADERLRGANSGVDGSATLAAG